MRVEEILEELEEILKEAWNLPLSGGKAFVNTEKIIDLINEMRDEFPNELRQAKAIIADRAQIVNDAKGEGEAIIAAAEKKAALLIERDEIVKQAEKQAEEIVLEAKKKAREMKQATNEYVDDVIKRTDEVLTEAVTELRRTRQSIKGSNM